MKPGDKVKATLGESVLAGTAEWIASGAVSLILGPGRSDRICLTIGGSWHIEVIEPALPALPPEPPVGSVVMDDDEVMWYRDTSGWIMAGMAHCPESWDNLLNEYAPLTVMVPGEVIGGEK